MNTKRTFPILTFLQQCQCNNGPTQHHGFFLGVVKDDVYVLPLPTTLEELRQWITKACAKIDNDDDDVLQKG